MARGLGKYSVRIQIVVIALALLATVSFAKETQNYDTTIQIAAEYSGLDWRLLKAQLETENSTFDSRAKSSAGAIGCGQFLPKTWDWLMERYRLDWNIRDCEDGIFGMSLYMRYLMERCQSELPDTTDLWGCAISAYNHGEGNVFRKLKKLGRFTWNQFKKIAPTETRNYRKKILSAVKLAIL